MLNQVGLDPQAAEAFLLSDEGTQEILNAQRLLQVSSLSLSSPRSVSQSLLPSLPGKCRS